MSLGDLGDILDGHQIPNPITRHYQNLVVIFEQEVLDFRFARHAHSMSNCVPQGARQVQPDDVLVVGKYSELLLRLHGSLPLARIR